MLSRNKLSLLCSSKSVQFLALQRPGREPLNFHLLFLPWGNCKGELTLYLQGVWLYFLQSPMADMLSPDILFFVVVECSLGMRPPWLKITSRLLPQSPKDCSINLCLFFFFSVLHIEKARVGCFKKTASKHVYYLGWNGSPAQVGCMGQVLGPGAMGKPRGSRWRGSGGGSGWGTHVNPWLFHFNVWQNPLQIKIF